MRKPGPLTERELLFCHEFIKDLNGTQAYMRSFESKNDGTASTQSSKLLRKPEVQRCINKAMKNRYDRVDIDADYVLQGIIEVHRRCTQAIPVMKWCPVEKKKVASGEWEFKEAGALKALELLGRHLKMFNEKIDVNIRSSVEDILIKAREKDLEIAEKKIQEVEYKEIKPKEKNGLKTIKKTSK